MIMILILLLFVWMLLLSQPKFIYDHRGCYWKQTDKKSVREEFILVELFARIFIYTIVDKFVMRLRQWDDERVESKDYRCRWYEKFFVFLPVMCSSGDNEV